MFATRRSVPSWLRAPQAACIAALALACSLLPSVAAQRASNALPSKTAQQNPGFGRLPLSFEPNRGQADGKVQFLAHSPAATVYLAGTDAYLRTSHNAKDSHGRVTSSSADTVSMHLAGASTHAVATPEDAQTGTVTYMRGADRQKWQTALPTYGAVTFASVYPGVDLRYYGRQGQLEYDFTIAPNADASMVKLQFDGALAMVADNGDLVLPAGKSTLRFDKPVAYQTLNGRRVKVDAAFAMNANHDVTFRLGSYDHSHALVIDPTLVYLGTIGTGTQQTDVSQIVVDSAGALYLIGTTNDSTYPVTAGSYQTVCGPDAGSPGQTTYGGTYCSSTGGLSSAYITKLSPDGTQLIYSTYLSGHAGYETGNSIAIDSAGVAYLLGETASNDFPITADAFQSQCQPAQPINFHPTYLPPTSQCDNYHNGGGTQYTINGPVAYMAKLSADGTSLLYASFLGGSYPVYAVQTALDANGNWYMYNQTTAATPSDLYGTGGGNVQFPGVTASAYQTVSDAHNPYNNNLENNDVVGVLSKFSNDGKTLLYGSFFGDTMYNTNVVPTTMAVGANGVAFIGGYTQSVNLPTTPGAIKTACTQVQSDPANCNTLDSFVAAFDTTKIGAASLAYSTRLGGAATSQGSNIPNQKVFGMTADSSNNLFATGYTYDHTFPVGTGGYQPTCPNYDATKSTYDYCDSAFLVKLNPTGTAVLAGTFLGGPSFRSAESVGYNVRLDSKGQVYLYGRSNDGGGDFPQVNPLQAYKGGNQLFISAFTADLTKLLFSTRFGNPSYTDHNVSPAGGMVLDNNDNIYFAGTTTDTTFAGTAGTYNTAATTGQGRHTFFAKLSRVLQPNTTTLTLTPATVATGNMVAYKAVVTGIYQTAPAATGTVTFSATNTTPATVLGSATLDATGTATFTATAPAAGTYTVVASYGADTVYDVSTSNAATLTVNNAAITTTTLVATPAAAKVGGTVTLTSSVTGAGGTPTGSVTFMDGASTLGTAALVNGSAPFTTTSLGIGTHTLTAVYSGDTTFGQSTSTAQTVTVTAYTVGVAFTATPAVAPTGSAVMLSATLTGAAASPAPTGKITFFNGTTVVGSITLASNAASLTTMALPAGADSLTAVYSGDANYATATSAAQTVVVRAPAATTTMLATSSATTSAGSPVTFTATITSAATTGMPSGTVTFLDGTTTLGTGTVAAGSATYTTSALAVGAHTITATYSGDALFLASTSTGVTQTVTAATIALSAAPTSLTIARGASGTTTITVTPMGAYSGAVSFSCGAVPQYAHCSFAPATLTFAGSQTAQSAVLTVSTNNSTSAMLRSAPALSRIVAATLFLPLGLFGVAARRKPRPALLTLCVLMSLGVLGLIGCGGSSSTNTPAGSYTIPVVAASGGTTTMLNVQVLVQ